MEVSSASLIIFTRSTTLADVPVPMLKMLFSSLLSVSINDWLFSSLHCPDELADEVCVYTFMFFVGSVDRHESKSDRFQFRMRPMKTFTDMLHRDLCNRIMIGWNRRAIFF